MTNTNMTQGHGLGAGAILLHNLAKNWWALALVVGLLTLEWFLRKFNGLS